MLLPVLVTLGAMGSKNVACVKIAMDLCLVGFTASKNISICEE